MAREGTRLIMRIPVWLAACAVLASSPALRAQQEGEAHDDPDLSGPRVNLNLRSVGYYSDNFYNQPSDEASTLGTLVNPEIGFLEESAKLQVMGKLHGEYGVFDLPGSEDDYLDGGARFRLVSQGTASNQVRIGATFDHGHDAFGVNRTEDASARDEDLDRWNQIDGSVHYKYGSAGARLNVELGLRGLDKHYITNRTATEVLNYTARTGEYTLYYNYSPKTAALVDFSRTNFSFDRPFGAVDERAGDLYRVRGGVRWQATGKTSGDVRVGWRERTFDNGSDDIEGADWEATLDWSPVPRTHFAFTTARSEQQSYSDGTRVIDIASYTMNWKYNLTARSRTTVVLERLNVDFDGASRDDNITTGAVGLEHLLRRNLTIVGNLGTISRSSTVYYRDYDRLSAFVGVRLGR